MPTRMEYTKRAQDAYYERNREEILRKQCDRQKQKRKDIKEFRGTGTLLKLEDESIESHQKRLSRFI